MRKRVAELFLVGTLQAVGVKNCYGIVGDTLNRIAHAIDIARAMLHGKGHDVWEMVVENIP